MFKFNKSYTQEELLILKTMHEIKNLINQCAFQFLIIPMDYEIPTENGNIKKFYKYIIKNKKMYLDENNNVFNKDLNLDKSCFKFNKKFKNFKELEYYELYFQNIDAIKNEFNIQHSLKMKLYGKNIMKF